MLDLRKMTAWFGDSVGGKILCEGVHTLENWKKFCGERLSMRGRNFTRHLDKKEQERFFSSRWVAGGEAKRGGTCTKS